MDPPQAQELQKSSVNRAHTIKESVISSCNITIELMFADLNMFLARLRLILARATGEG